MNSGIYKIVNTVNGKFYVGSAVNFDRRRRNHWNRLKRGTHANKHLQAAWNKYGAIAFVFEVLERVPSEERLLREDVWLAQYVGKSYCYNIGAKARAAMEGRCGPLSPTWGRTFKHTPEAIEKIRVASIGRAQSEFTRAKRKQTMRGHAVSAETRAKISASLQGPTHPFRGKKRPEFAEKVRVPVLAVSPKGERQEFDSIQSLRAVLGLKPSTVNRALKSEALLARGPYKGWRFSRQPRKNVVQDFHLGIPALPTAPADVCEMVEPLHIQE